MGKTNKASVNIFVLALCGKHLILSPLISFSSFCHDMHVL